MRSLLVLLVCAATARADLFLAGFDSGGVYRFDETSGAPIGSGVFIQPHLGGLQLPHGIMRLADGTFIVASAGTDELLHYSSIGEYIGPFVQNGLNGVPANTLNYPVDLKLGPDGALYVTSQLNDRVVRFDPVTGAYLSIFVEGGIDGPSGLAFHPNGDLYVVGRFSDNVVRFDGDTGSVVGTFSATGFGQPFGIAVSPLTQQLYIVDGGTNQIRRIDPTTGVTLGNITGGTLAFPVGGEFGPGNDLYVASLANDKVARFDGVTGLPEGDFAIAGTTGLDSPNFMTFAVPEPQTALLIAASCVFLCRRRRA